ncbi:hypothetical protein ACES2J_15325 [Bdellovibrio bacteriovorus]|uniref:hypothetical protein n=1 Tax=Bdellovibrio bacteriovorus TaxID=959 RepID=UPI0035A6D524
MKKILFEAIGIADETIEKIKNESKSLFAVGVSSASVISQQVSSMDWFQSLNTYKSEVSKAMDSDFLKSGVGAIDADTLLKFSPSNHRILDGGHTFFESIERARQIGKENDWSNSEIFQEWSKAYFTDLSSPAGMPVFGDLTENLYLILRKVFDEETARDLVTVNGQEAVEAILAGTLSAVGLFFAWKKEDKENFSKTIGALLVGGAVSINPLTLAIAVVAMAMGYNSLVCGKAISRGGIIAGATFTVSALVPGPVVVGLIPAIVVAIYLNKKMGKDFDAVIFGKRAYDYLRSDEFKVRMDYAMSTLGGVR